LGTFGSFADKPLKNTNDNEFDKAASRQTEIWKRSSLVLDPDRDGRFASGAFSEP
jgi:hypothetical protein